MGHLSAGLLATLLTLLTPTIDGIGRTCLANDAAGLSAYFSGAALNISLPDPIAFSDELSPEQAYFLFDRVFSKFKTFEFDPDGRLSTLAGRPGCILKARWSFRNIKDDSPSLFLVMIYLTPEEAGWKIVEIKAERQ